MLGFVQAIATGVVMNYVPTASFVSGSLIAQNLGNAAISSVPVAAGQTTFSGLTAGRYAFYVDENDISGLSVRSNVVIVLVPTVPSTNQDMQVSHRGDATTFETLNKPLDLMRLSVYANRSCHYFIWRVGCDAQNARLVIRSINYHLRQRGKPGSAETRYGS